MDAENGFIASENIGNSIRCRFCTSKIFSVDLCIIRRSNNWLKLAIKRQMNSGIRFFKYLRSHDVKDCDQCSHSCRCKISSIFQCPNRKVVTEEVNIIHLNIKSENLLFRSRPFFFDSIYGEKERRGYFDYRAISAE